MVAYWLFGLDIAGSLWLVVLIAVANAVLGVALGLLVSAFARTEFQAVQFMPVVVVPQILLCGLFVPRNQMAGWLQGISNLLPMTYAVEALQEVGMHRSATGRMWRDLGDRRWRSSCSRWPWRAPPPSAGGPADSTGQ